MRCFLHRENATSSVSCLPKALLNSTFSEVKAFVMAAYSQPPDASIFGCCPGMQLYTQYQSCSGFETRMTCNNATTALNATCRLRHKTSLF